MDKIRPRSVSVIAWINIVFGISGIYNVIQMPRIFSDPKYQKIAEISSSSLQLSMIVSGIFSVLFLASGIAMLKGFNWGRLLYLIGVGIMVLLNLLSHGFSPLSLPGIIVYITFFIFLTRPAAVEFFKGQDQNLK
ncbi:MAG: hypothetical protein ABIH18_09665 [Candidatus Omnitrophota bacterium]